MSDETYSCHTCGKTYEYTGEEVVCWCGREATVVVKPCPECKSAFSANGDICRDCAKERDVDAFTPYMG